MNCPSNKMQLDQGDEASRSFWAGLGLRGNSLKLWFNGNALRKTVGEPCSYRLSESLGVLFIPIHPYMLHLPTGAFVCPRSQNTCHRYQKNELHSTFRVLNLGIGLGFLRPLPSLFRSQGKRRSLAVHLPTILVGFYRKCTYLDIQYMNAMG